MVAPQHADGSKETVCGKWWAAFQRLSPKGLQVAIPVASLPYGRGMARARVRTVIINAVDRDTVVAFWTQLLGVAVLEADEEARITWLQPDTPGGVNIGVQQVDRKVGMHTEVHLDVAVADLDACEAEVIAAGGALVKRNQSAGGFQWRVLADPEGNELCIFREGPVD